MKRPPGGGLGVEGEGGVNDGAKARESEAVFNFLHRGLTLNAVRWGLVVADRRGRRQAPGEIACDAQKELERPANTLELALGRPARGLKEVYFTKGQRKGQACG